MWNWIAEYMYRRIWHQTHLYITLMLWYSFSEQCRTLFSWIGIGIHDYDRAVIPILYTLIMDRVSLSEVNSSQLLAISTVAIPMLTWCWNCRILGIVGRIWCLRPALKFLPRISLLTTKSLDRSSLVAFSTFAVWNKVSCIIGQFNDMNVV